MTVHTYIHTHSLRERSQLTRSLTAHDRTDVINTSWMFTQESSTGRNAEQTSTVTIRIKRTNTTHAANFVFARLISAHARFRKTTRIFDSLFENIYTLRGTLWYRYRPIMSPCADISVNTIYTLCERTV